MRLTSKLLQHTAQVTLFTRKRCSLCETARAILEEVRSTRSVDYHEINVMSKGQEQWKAMYEYDAPVVHIQRVFHTYAKPNIITEPGKLFHRFERKDVERLIEEAEGHS